MVGGYILKCLGSWLFSITPGVAHYLGGLSSGGVSSWPEVGPVVITRLAWATTSITSHIPSVSKAVDPLVERLIGGHVLEYLRSRVVLEVSSIRYYLGKLASGHKSIWSERAI